MHVIWMGCSAYILDGFPFSVLFSYLRFGSCTVVSIFSRVFISESLSYQRLFQKLFSRGFYISFWV